MAKVLILIIDFLRFICMLYVFFLFEFPGSNFYWGDKTILTSYLYWSLSGKPIDLFHIPSWENPTDQWAVFPSHMMRGGKQSKGLGWSSVTPNGRPMLGQHLGSVPVNHSTEWLTKKIYWANRMPLHWSSRGPLNLPPTFVVNLFPSSWMSLIC